MRRIVVRPTPCCEPHRALVPAPGYGFWTKTYPAIREGASDSASDGAVLWVARKLLGEDVESYPTFDAQLTAAVRAFQTQNGLAVDGVVGPNTYKALGFTGNVRTAGSVEGSRAPITQRVWFWPATILVSALGIAAGIVFWPRRNEYVARAKAWRK